MLVIVNDAGGKDFNQHSEAAPYLDAKFEMVINIHKNRNIM